MMTSNHPDGEKPKQPANKTSPDLDLSQFANLIDPATGKTFRDAMSAKAELLNLKATHFHDTGVRDSAMLTSAPPPAYQFSDPYRASASRHIPRRSRIKAFLNGGLKELFRKKSR